MACLVAANSCAATDCSGVIHWKISASSEASTIQYLIGSRRPASSGGIAHHQRSEKRLGIRRSDARRTRFTHSNIGNKVGDAKRQVDALGNQVHSAVHGAQFKLDTRVPLPEVMAGNTLSLEGQTLEVRGLDDSLPHRSYVWIPSIKTIAGGVSVYAGLHLWTTDAQSLQERADWAKKLGAMATLQPSVVIPGLSLPGQKHDASQLLWSQAYLTRLEQELPNAAMKKAYPDAGLGIALDQIGIGTDSLFRQRGVSGDLESTPGHQDISQRHAYLNLS